MRVLQFNEKHNVIYGEMEPVVGHRLEAVVLYDGLKRFKEGDPIITSPVESISGSSEAGCMTVNTRNTTYAFIPAALYVEGTTAVKLLSPAEHKEKQRQDLVLGN